MNKLRLHVTEEILERVVFGMENQKDRLFLDPSDGLLRPEKDDDGSLIPLPDWGPTDGYRLMDGFTGSLPDTAFRERLVDILHSGSGVFRNFKDALKERPELEGLWRRYKKREMRKTALSWLSRWSEALALEALGPEPEDWDQLSSVEFIIREIREEERVQIQSWNKLAEAENFPGISYDAWSVADSGSGFISVAEGPSGEIVGFSWLYMNYDSGRPEGRLIQVYVIPELRGLGIGRMLIAASMEQAVDKGAGVFTLRTGVSGKILEKYFESEDFTPVMTVWRKNL